ncbi:MAG: hypothetical protein V7L21_12675 [Nostoc sp.]|uniref:hypothetical protein n=1 Tax=unclassified Nostoc TaxID=2593658 RepID=UPI0025F84B87|nr:hypothetical protein [Nostoc sp. NMS9]MBN3940816.1 hypothetical protein [Nostoc sp. NMS9]
MLNLQTEVATFRIIQKIFLPNCDASVNKLRSPAYRTAATLLMSLIPLVSSG